VDVATVELKGSVNSQILCNALNAADMAMWLITVSAKKILQLWHAHN